MQTIQIFCQINLVLTAINRIITIVKKSIDDPFAGCWCSFFA